MLVHYDEILPASAFAMARRNAIATATFSPPLIDLIEISPPCFIIETSKSSFTEMSVISRLKCFYRFVPLRVLCERFGVELGEIDEERLIEILAGIELSDWKLATKKTRLDTRITQVSYNFREDTNICTIKIRRRLVVTYLLKTNPSALWKMRKRSGIRHDKSNKRLTDYLDRE